jgi:dephospho-CoA kinase
LKLILCVTGKIGTGKSTVSKFFKEKGFEYINMDELGKIAFEYEKDKILEVFNTLERNKIRDIVFQDQKMLKKLEKILHPKMLEILEQMTAKENYYAIEAAIKRRLKIKCDFTITVKCILDTILKRVSERGLSQKDIENILKNQMDILDEGIIINNDGTIKELYEKLEKIYTFIMKSASF